MGLVMTTAAAQTETITTTERMPAAEASLKRGEAAAAIAHVREEPVQDRQQLGDRGLVGPEGAAARH